MLLWTEYDVGIMSLLSFFFFFLFLTALCSDCEPVQEVSWMGHGIFVSWHDHDFLQRCLLKWFWPAVTRFLSPVTFVPVLICILTPKRSTNTRIVDSSRTASFSHVVMSSDLLCVELSWKRTHHLTMLSLTCILAVESFCPVCHYMEAIPCFFSQEPAAVQMSITLWTEFYPCSWHCREASSLKPPTLNFPPFDLPREAERKIT